MKRSFRNPITGVLTAHGFCDSNGADLARDEPDDFSLAPGKWRLEGDEWVVYEHVSVPAQVTMRQARLALLQAGLLSQVAGVIDAMPSPQKEAAQIEWEYSQTVERHRQLVAVLAPALGLSDEQTDQLFITAATL